jgi:hypothetical protein
MQKKEEKEQNYMYQNMGPIPYSEFMAFTKIRYKETFGALPWVCFFSLQLNFFSFSELVVCGSRIEQIVEKI